MVRHLALVDFVAAKLQARLPSHVDVGDLKQAGTFGLADAIDRFQPARGVRFTTYAPLRIRGAMVDYIREVDWVPRLVRARGEPVVGLVSLSRKKFETDSSREVREVDMLADDDTPEAHIGVERRDLIDRLTEGMHRHERLAFELYWFQDVTMKEIGRAIGLSESRVSQIMKGLLPRIRSRFGAGELAELLDVA